MIRWRWLWLCLAAGALGAGEPPSLLRPLAMSGAALEAVDHALIRLAQGDTNAVEALPLDAFLDPVARPDPHTPGLARRWTMALPAALARLDPLARGHALTRLDAQYRTLAATRSGLERARLASAFLPAPSAVADLASAVDRAFDLGRLDDFLGMALLLAGAGERVVDERRNQVAVRLSGLGPQVDAALRLPPPGMPLPTTGRSDLPGGHLAIRWQLVPGWVLACDPFAEVVWQYHVDRQAEITVGPGAVLVRDSTGLRALAEDGSVTTLPPLPAGATVLAIAGGCAWFATGERAWRLGLRDGVVQMLALDAPPLGPPLVRGPQSLWLTARELLLFDQDHLAHRFQHGLPATTGWQLGADGERPVVRAGEGRQWRLESFTDQLARLDGAARADLLIHAHRYQEALAAIGQPPPAAGRRLALRAHLGLGVSDVADMGEAAFGLCQDGQDRALVALAALAAAAPDHAATLRAVVTRQAVPADLLMALDRLAAADPTVRFTDHAAALGDDPAAWDHLCLGAAWTRWRQATPPPAPHGDPLVVMEPVHLEDAAQAQPAGTVARQADGGLRLGDRTFHLERGIDAITVTCHADAGGLLWRQRWRPSSFLSAPSQTIDVRDGLVQVLEGGLRLNVFDAQVGVRVATFTVDDLGSGTAFVLGATLAVIGPLGVDSGCTFSDSSGTTRSLVFPSPARWMAPIAGQLLVRGQDGVARLYPDGRIITLPDLLGRSHQAPLVTSAGLVLGDQLWRWSR